MKTKLFMLLVLVVLTASVNAQSKDSKPFKIGVGAVIGLSVGDLSTDFRYGVDLQGEYAASPLVGLTVSAGYLGWVGGGPVYAAIGGYGRGNTRPILPVLAGARYYFADKLFGSAQAGVSIYTEKGAGNYFTFAPGIGYKISEKFDLLLKYQSIIVSGGNINFMGVRAGLSF